MADKHRKKEEVQKTEVELNNNHWRDTNDNGKWNERIVLHMQLVNTKKIHTKVLL